MDFKHFDIRFFTFQGQVNWKCLLVRSNKCTTQTTRTIDFATPESKCNVLLTSYLLCILYIIVNSTPNYILWYYVFWRCDVMTSSYHFVITWWRPMAETLLKKIIVQSEVWLLLIYYKVYLPVESLARVRAGTGQRWSQPLLPGPCFVLQHTKAT